MLVGQVDLPVLGPQLTGARERHLEVQLLVLEELEQVPQRSWSRHRIGGQRRCSVVGEVSYFVFFFCNGLKGVVVLLFCFVDASLKSGDGFHYLVLIKSRWLRLVVLLLILLEKWIGSL